MNGKLTPAVEASEAPRRARVRVQEPDLLRKHSLTLIGKVTNPSVQKVPSLIQFFTKHWKANEEIKTVRSDLGKGLFQFQFDSESDLLSILANRPYHFAKWMLILQRWEPTVSPSFPSLIPFWIKVEGIPAHLWTEETIRSIGEDIGRFERSDIIISTLSVRMRVHVNGRLPLIKSSVIEYPNGDEVTASLVYEKLEKHCSHCYRLDHELKDCLAAKHQKKKKKANALALPLALSVEEQSSSYGSIVVTTERLRQAEEQGQLEQTDATTTVPSNSHNGISKQQKKKKKKNSKSRSNDGSKADKNAVPPPQAPELLLATLASFLPATCQPESRQTIMSGGTSTLGEAPPQAWRRDSQTVRDDASNQVYQYNPPPRGGMVRGNNMPLINYASSEASVQNQNYGPVSSYQQQANNYHGVTTNQAHHFFNPSRFQAAMQPAPDKANLEPQRQAAQLQAMLYMGLGMWRKTRDIREHYILQLAFFTR